MPAPVTPSPEPSPELLEAAGLRLERSGRRLDVVLARPDRRNAQTPTTWRAFAAVGAWAGDVADVVVIRGDGPSFSAGLDRRAFSPEGIPGELSLFELAQSSDDRIDAVIAEYQEGFSCWSSGDFLSVAAVQGHAIGGGFQLALACDLRIVADDVRFAMREPALGIVPDLGGTHPLVAAVGYGRALDICATGRWVEADEAAAIGLVQSVVPPAELGTAVDTFVAAVLAAPIGAVLATKALLRDAVTRTPEQQRAAERCAQVTRLRALAGS